eukprot:INCI2774.1.p1 GENE.INCI2774.1~~INCI2774.1.p1  ORF type:complete len:299 (-),score=32.04 INCI2774.1:1287-2183(-)
MGDVTIEVPIEWTIVRLEGRPSEAWFRKVMEEVSTKMHIFDAVGFSVRDEAHHKDTIVAFSVLQQSPGLLACFDWNTHTVTVLRSSHRFVKVPSPASGLLPTSFRPPSAPREGRGRPLSAISSDKIKGGKRLRPARREGHGRPATAFPSDKFHGNQRPRPTLKEGLGRPVTGSGRDSPTGVAGLTVADTVRPSPSASPPVQGRSSLRQVSNRSSDSSDVSLETKRGGHMQRPKSAGLDRSEGRIKFVVQERPDTASTTNNSGRRGVGNTRPESSSGDRHGGPQGSGRRNPRTFGLGPL